MVKTGFRAQALQPETEEGQESAWICCWCDFVVGGSGPDTTCVVDVRELYFCSQLTPCGSLSVYGANRWVV